MTLYDSSVLIDYLSGEDAAVDYVTSKAEERALAPPLVLFEVYQGEVFKSGAADFDAVDDALEWLTVVDESREFARSSAELQNDLAIDGTPLAAREAFIAGAAMHLGETLAVADSDFDVAGLAEGLDVDLV